MHNIVFKYDWASTTQLKTFPWRPYTEAWPIFFNLQESILWLWGSSANVLQIGTEGVMQTTCEEAISVSWADFASVISLVKRHSSLK